MIGVAILGAGIGSQHLDAYRKLPDFFDVLWVVDKDVERARALSTSEEFCISDNLEDALKDPSVSVVDICLPPHLHAPVTLKALASGKHVICEKPLGTSFAQVADIEAAANASEKHVYPVFQYRWAPAFTHLRHLIASGWVGKPLVAALETHWARDRAYYAAPWRGTWAEEQGGAVLGHAIHAHDLLTHFMGPVASVSARTATRVNDIETEDCAAIIFEMANGALATSSVTLGAAGDETRLRFVFENLTATSDTIPYAPGTGDWVFEARDPTRQTELENILSTVRPELSGFEGFLQATASDLNGNVSGAVTLQEGVASIGMVTAIYHAARTGDRVCLPITINHPLYEGWQP